MRATALRWSRLHRTERSPRASVLELQRRRLADLLAHAWSRSPFYRKRWGGHAPRPEDLGRLEPLAKSDLLENYDQVLADRSLDRGVLWRLLAGEERSRHVVLATSGTTGEPVMIPYSRAEWVEGLALCLRGEGRRSSSPLRSLRVSRRLAAVMTQNPIHASTRINASFRFPFLRQLRLEAGAALAEQIAALNAFQPTTLAGYPSAVDPLARAQLAGDLSIRPARVLIGGETPPAGLRERARSAWGAEVFDCYGLTETLVVGWECHQHAGMHVDEDAVILEVVGEDDRPLAPGETGMSVLVTNLYNRTLPLIRYRVGDALSITDAPCACGAPFARIAAVEGRRDEVLHLRARGGASAIVHPATIEAPLEALPGVRRFQIQEEAGILCVRIEGQESGSPLREAVEKALRGALDPLGVAPEAIRIDIAPRVEEERGRTGKRRRIIRS